MSKGQLFLDIFPVIQEVTVTKLDSDKSCIQLSQNYEEYPVKVVLRKWTQNKSHRRYDDLRFKPEVMRSIFGLVVTVDNKYLTTSSLLEERDGFCRCKKPIKALKSTNTRSDQPFCMKCHRDEEN